MQNFFTLETEVAHRRFEYERVLAVEIQVAQTHPDLGHTPWSQLPHQILTSLRSFAMRWVPVKSWQATGGRALRPWKEVVPR